MAQLSNEILSAFVDLVKTTMAQMQKKVDDFEESMNSITTENIQLIKNHASMEKRLRVTQGLVTQLQTKIHQQEEQIIELKSRSMRDNVVLSGIPEDNNETWEMTKAKVNGFLKDVLEIPEDELQGIEIDKAHRIGSKSDENSRRIVAKFCKSSSKDVLFKHVKKLKDKPQYSLNEQLPPEIQERRKRLWPKYKEAKSNPHITDIKWNMDKLIINKKVYTAKDDQTPVLLSEDPPPMDIVHTTPQVKDGSSFIGHAAEVKSQDEVSAVLSNLTSDFLFAGASHTIYAYRIGRQTNVKELCNDDGDHGLGSTILRKLKDLDRRNIIVVVSRWMKGEHIGPARFRMVEDCVEAALKELDKI